MILKPRLEDLKIIGFYLGKIILGLAFTMVIPILTGLFCKEFNPALDFIIGIEISVFIGLLLLKVCLELDRLLLLLGGEGRLGCWCGLYILPAKHHVVHVDYLWAEVIAFQCLHSRYDLGYPLPDFLKHSLELGSRSYAIIHIPFKGYGELLIRFLCPYTVFHSAVSLGILE